jgi:hypothetical protein
MDIPLVAYNYTWVELGYYGELPMGLLLITECV